MKFLKILLLLAWPVLAATPPDAVARLNDAFRQVLESPDIR